MSLIELLHVIQALPRADKLRLMQVLVTDIAQDEAVELTVPKGQHAIWSPHDSYDAAATLMEVLEQDRMGHS